VGGRGIVLLLLEGMGVYCHAPAALPPGITRYPMYWGLGGSCVKFMVIPYKFHVLFRSGQLIIVLYGKLLPDFIS
jgi:hypothetical protein